jgi:1-acyl-sn-glycerol-3-phosphate acyltransferase
MRALVSSALWIVGLAYYATCLGTTLILTFLAPPTAFDPALKAAMRGLFRLIGVRVQVDGLQHVSRDRAVIYFPAPHCSLLDVPLAAGFLPGLVRGPYAAGQDRWPLYSRVMRRLGNIPIERSDVHTSITNMKRVDAILESGASLVIFPESHRTTTGDFLPFKKLPFHFAAQADRPLVPVAIQGMFNVNNKTSWMLRPGTVRVRFGEEIGVDVVARLSAVELRDLVEERVRGLLEEPSGPGASHP